MKGGSDLHEVGFPSTLPLSTNLSLSHYICPPFCDSHRRYGPQRPPPTTWMTSPWGRSASRMGLLLPTIPHSSPYNRWVWILGGQPSSRGVFVDHERLICKQSLDCYAISCVWSLSPRKSQSRHCLPAAPSAPSACPFRPASYGRTSRSSASSRLAVALSRGARESGAPCPRISTRATCSLRAPAARRGGKEAAVWPLTSC